MKTITLKESQATDYNISQINTIKMPQNVNYPAFSSIGKPKAQNLLLLVNDCKTEYTTADKKQLRTQDGDVVYIPKGSEYRVQCIENNKNSSTLQINFSLSDENADTFVFSSDIQIFTLHDPTIRTLFEKIILLGESASVSKTLQKSVLYEILSTLSEDPSNNGTYDIIMKGVKYLNAHYDENPSVPSLAAMCNVSNEYFRKLFKKQTGQSPTEYKNTLRIKKAEQYLLYSNMPISEISERLSFATVSHFIKRFKEINGISPLSFRMSGNKI